MELVAKYLSGNANDEEKRQVEEWRIENPEEFLSYSEAWSASGLQAYELASARENVMRRIANQQRFEQQTYRQTGFRWAWIAAAVVLVAGASWFFVTGIGSGDAGQAVDAGWMVVKTGAEETKEIELADGSVVSLNEASSLSYPAAFSDRRSVKLSGTAFFEIKPDKDHPFTVETPEAVVTVLGTSFQVKTAQNYSEVIVETGLVSIAKKPQQNKAEKSVKINLAPGEMGVVRSSGGGVAKTKNKDQNYLAWKTRRMVFSKTPMKDVAATLSSVYKVEVKLENKEIGDCRLTATFDKKEVKEIVEVISQTFGFEVAASSDRYVLKGMGCK